MLAQEEREPEGTWTIATAMGSGQGLSRLSLQGRKAELGLINLAPGGEGRDVPVPIKPATKQI